jgi:hypothetical protein
MIGDSKQASLDVWGQDNRLRILQEERRSTISPHSHAETAKAPTIPAIRLSLHESIPD